MGARLEAVRKTVKTLTRWTRDERGGVATMFAALSLPLLMATGVGFDVSRVVGTRVALQDATDSAGLALARIAAQTVDDGNSTADQKLTTKASTWITSNVNGGAIVGGDDGITVSAHKLSGGKVTIDASAQVQPTLAAMLHLGPFGVSSHSEVTYGLSHVELSLVLDNTGSMADDNKLSSLKTAAKSLIDTLSASAAATNDANAFKVAVVPFSMAVNIGTPLVGTSYRGQSWLVSKTPSAYDNGGGTGSGDAAGGTDRFAALDKMGVAWKGCVESRPMPYDVQDTAPDVSTPATLFVPYFAPDEPDDNTVASGTSKGKTTYYDFPNNYEGDGSGASDWQSREQRNTKYTKAPPVGKSYIHPYWGDPIGPNSGCNVAPLLRLSTSTTTAKAEIDSMVAVGDTEIPLGLIWGWHTLSPNLPFADGQAYGTKNLLKIVVLVTDGQNTYGNSGNSNASYYTAYGYGWQRRITSDSGATTSASALDDRLKRLCSNMNAKGIVMYTVPVEVTDKNIKSLLQNCASQPSNYIDVSSSSQLQAAFNNIAGAISALRISH